MREGVVFPDETWKGSFTEAPLPEPAARKARTEPPTGTRKFLSVDWTKPSSRPWRDAEAIAFMQPLHCTPYALLAMCGTPSSAHTRARSSRRSTARGAKHEVVESTQSTCATHGQPIAEERRCTA